MIPKNDFNPEFDVVIQETNTYKLQNNQEDIVGHTNEKEAMAQAIYLMLQTERYKHNVYSWNYGIELRDLFGLPPKEVIPRLPRRIESSLYTDERVLNITNYEFAHGFNWVLAKFNVHTIFGDLKIKGKFKQDESGVYRFEQND